MTTPGSSSSRRIPQLIPHRLLRNNQRHHPAVVEEARRRGAKFQLRLADGIDRSLFASMTGAEPVAALGEARLAPLVAAGYLEVNATHLKATAAGRQRLNALLERLIA